ncbi:quinone oxidoreductase family protein [Ramlibacter rhizophilus]|uniref:Zinc-binding alcohol dehydrogenase family protein n=1 Tax=Ramlibacter rhizophilus TaxID=1781167 RepID=A0A4Z0C2V7_9BURK|nr:zinc-binding alcohol dehydrogenase family protein [Ramlibacter rhizophilus]TFZ04555.1 zinc-binding alcohol dehydrogenase family protein [Ramlibacter rhizophilus]
MKALRVHAWGQRPVWEDLEPPLRTPGHSLVRLKAASVGHIDATVWGGRFPLRPSLPYVPGTEASGTVLESERFRPGTRVWLRGGGLGTRRDGTWREIVEAHDESMGELPEGVSFETGAAFFSPATSAWCALHELGGWAPAQEVLVTGASGAVGSLACQLARLAGARVRAVMGPRSTRPEGVECVGLDELQPQASLLIDTVGGEVLPAALKGVAPGGRAVLVGYTAGTQLTLDLPRLMLADVALLPLNMVRREEIARQRAPDLLARLASGALRLTVETLPLAAGGAVLEQLAQRRGRGRAVLVA